MPLGDRMRHLDERTGAARVGAGLLYLLPFWTGAVGVFCLAVGVAGILNDTPDAVVPGFSFAAVSLALCGLFTWELRTRRRGR